MRLLAFAAVALAAVPASAQQDLSKVEVKVEKIAPGVAVLFAVSGLLTVLGQVRFTEWVKQRWTPAQAITRGLLLMAAAFLPLAMTAATTPAAGSGPPTGWSYAAAVTPVLTSTVLLTVATMIVYPFEMATIVNLAGERTVGTYYGLYNTLAGMVMLLLGRLPNTADSVEWEGWRFEVVDMDGKRVDKLLVQALAAAESDTAGGEAA